MINYIKLIRPINLLMIVFTQFIIKLGLLQPLQVEVALNVYQLGLLTFATICIAAAGYVINDIFDIPIDRINKPDTLIIGKKITEKAGYNFYIFLNILGVGTGFYLSRLVDKPILATLFIICSFLLYLYAFNLKAIVLAGNIIVSILVAMSLLIVVLFDIYPAIYSFQSEKQLLCAQIILGYAGFAFFINLIREIVKDLQDIDGDKNGGRISLPIMLGRQRTTNLIFSLGVIALVTILIYSYQNLFMFQNIAFYFVFLIGGSLLLFCIKAWNAKTKKQFGILSILLKIIMLIGIGSIPIYASKLIV